MKKIKFQAYVVKQYLSGANGIGSPGIDEWEEMVEVSGISFVGEEIDYVTDKEGDEYSYVDNSLKAVREYTGLKDKNDVEIYEGDIYENPQGALFKIQYEPQEAAYLGVSINREYSGVPLINISGVAKGRVIGNIYLNPKLLDNKK